ncbi:MAG: hypothetical protein RIA69_02675 [Cyclobacteriaceae bacterium]
MTKSVKRLIIVIGSLSIMSSVFLALNGADFVEYFSGIFIGITLIGSVFFIDQKVKSDGVK